MHTTQHIAYPESQERNGQARFFHAVSAITGILIAILFGLTPPGVDDLLFLLPAKGCEPGVGLWGMMMGEWPRIWLTETGRLGNFIAMPILYLMPKWIFGIITGGLTYLLIILSCRLTRSRYGSIISWLLYASIILAYPWYDFLTMVTYAVNYIWSAVAAVGAILCFINIKSYSIAKTIAACLLMFAAGWMHEGFGAPLTAGLTLSLVLQHNKVGKRQILSWICAGAGTCMTTFSPTFWTRSGEELNLLMKYPYKEIIMNIGPVLIFLTAMAFISVWIISSHKVKKGILLTVPSIILITATLVATAVFLKFYTGPRTAAPALLYSMLACGYILTSAIGNRRIPTRLQWLTGILIGGFSIAHLAYADYAQTDITKEFKTVTHLYETSDDGVVYYDLAYPKADLSLFKTSVRQLHERVPKEFIRKYFKPEHKMVILPTSMKDFNPDKALKSYMTPGAMIYNGTIVLPDTIDTESFHRIHILTEDGKYLPSRFRIDKFSCPDYGEFKILTPHIKVLNSSLKIKDTSLTDHSR